MVQQEDAGSAIRRFGCDSRWVHFSQRQDPVVQRRRLLAYTQATMVQVHPGSLEVSAQIRQSAERLGLNPGVCRFESCSGHRDKTESRLGRQLADHPRLERRMLWVQIPPEPLKHIERLWRSGVLVSLSRRRSRVQIPSDALERHGTQTGKAAKLKPS